MTPAELSDAVLRCVRDAVAARELDVPVPRDPRQAAVRAVRRAGGAPAGAEDAHYASSIALRLAGPAGLPAVEVAELVSRRLAAVPGVGRTEVAGPGFVNVVLDEDAPVELVRRIRAAGPAYGRADVHPVAGRGGSAGSPAGASGPAAPFVPAPHLRARVTAEVLERLTAAAGVPVAAPEAVDPLAVRPPEWLTEAGSPSESHPAGSAPAASPALPRTGAREHGRSEPDPLEAALLARLGSDDLRWALLRPAAGDVPRLPERPVQRERNPRFRVQYARARAHALSREAGRLGFDAEPGEVLADGPEAVAATEALCAALAAHPTELELAARHRAPDRFVRHLEVAADAFTRWNDLCPPLPKGEEKPSAAHRARLALAEAAGTVLAGGLDLLGVTAPAHL